MVVVVIIIYERKPTTTSNGTLWRFLLYIAVCVAKFTGVGPVTPPPPPLLDRAFGSNHLGAPTGMTNATVCTIQYAG